MHNDMNHYQAKTIAEILLFMIVTIGLFAMVSYWPAARAGKGGMVQKQNFKDVFPFDFQFHAGEKLMHDLQTSEIMR